MNGIKFDKYITKPVEVKAIRFSGWSNFHTIVSIVPPEFRTYFVAQGYEHHERTEREKDRSTGHVLDDAPAFLMMVIDGIYQRVDKGFWIVCGLDENWFVVSSADFQALYQLVTPPEDQMRKM